MMSGRLPGIRNQWNGKLRRETMRKMVIAAAVSLMVGGVSMMQSAPAFAQAAPAAKPAHYSVSTTLVEKLLADPAAVAILKELIPTVYANDQFQSAGRALTLKDIQQYEPEALSDENLAKIQAAFDKIPAKG
jgi:hypothetical protein